ncbi:LysM peptidoglycan-binding domain-containing protein [Lysinibacillus sp. NPDC048646]|uniref:LysM peptidoglycan-binding domain-containing protein n=1 Tax=Lysinibacillus sp. NPDC048646 TaxID=3390574 RepID=UPI003D00F174
MRIHIVQKGDTLWKIAKEYGISFEDLKRLNVHLANPDYIVPGMEIILPEKIHKETHNQGAHHQGTQHKETQIHKEMPTHKPVKESVKKEVQKPMPAPPIVAPPPMPMPAPQMIPIPFPMPMPQPMPQQPMWVPQPVELNWNQQLVMPQVEHPVLPPIQIQPPPPAPAPPPIAHPAPPPPPPPVHIMPQMPMMPHCPSCHQPMHHQMWWHMPMQPMHQMHQMQPMHHMHPQVEPCSMPPPPAPCPCPMPASNVAGAGHFLESSTSPFFPVNDAHIKHHFDPMPEMQMGQSCGCGSQPAMMPNWQFDPCNCPPPCPTPCPTCGPWMSPHFFPGGMTPYRW